MKILIDLTSLADNFSGIERYALNISLNLIKNKEHNFILCFKEKIHPVFQEFEGSGNIDFVVLKRCNKLLFNLFRLPKALKKFKVDYYLFLAFPAPLFFNKKNTLVTIHDLCCWDCPETMTFKSRIYFQRTLKHSLKIAKKIITVSAFSKNRIVERFNYNPDKILVCYDGISDDFTTYNPIDRIEEVDKKYNLPSKYILSLSTLEPRKNIKLLLKAYQSLVEENNEICDLVLAGRLGWKMEDLLNDVDKITLEKIHFTGFIEDEHLPYVYSNSEVFVFPSKYEGFGLPPLEAMACGTLVVSSNSASLPEVLGNGAIYFENDNCLSLIEQLKNALSITQEEKSRLQLISNEQSKKFSWEIEAQKILNIL